MPSADQVLKLVVELALAGRLTDHGVFSEDCERIRALWADCDTGNQAVVVPEQAELRAALSEACDQLEGWVAWKCPRKHKPEHLAFIARLRSLIGDETLSAAPPKVVDMEVLVWNDPSDPHRPDADLEVLVHFSDAGLLMAAWDDGDRWWRDGNGLLINGGEVVGWAEPRGVTL